MTSGLFGSNSGGGSSNQTQDPVAATGISIQSSCYGLPVPIVIGTQRISGNMIEYFGFYAVPYYTQSPAQPSGGGGKGFGGGGGGGGSSWQLGGYNYYASLAFGLCEGPIAGVPSAWAGQSYSAPMTGFGVWVGTYPNTSPFFNSGSYAGLSFTAAYNYPLGSNAQIPNFNWEVKSVYANKGMSFGAVAAPDAWGRFLNLLGSSGNSVNDEWSVAIGNGWFTDGGISASPLDADPSIVVTVLLTDPDFGAGFPVENLGGVALTTEARTIPGTPFQLTANKSLNYAYNINVTGGAVLPSWFSLSAGTFVVGYMLDSVDYTNKSVLVSVADPTGVGQYVELDGYSGGNGSLATSFTAACAVLANGQSATVALPTTFALGVSNVVSLTYGTGRVATSSFNGVSLVSSTVSPNPLWSPGQLSDLQIGGDGVAASHSLHGSISYINYFSQDVSDAELTVLSTGTSPRTPDYQLNFLTLSVLPAGWTFTRASAKAYTDSSGHVATVSSGNPVMGGIAYYNGTQLGITIHPASINYCLQSQAMATSPWTATNATITNNNVVAPDGTTTATRIAPTAGAGIHSVSSGATATVAAGKVVVHSCYVKHGNQRYCTLYELADGSTAHGITYDFNLNAFSSTAATVLPIETLANGWFRIGFAYLATNVGTCTPQLSISFGTQSTSSTPQTYTAAGTETGFAWGAQIETGNSNGFMSPYIATTTVTVTRPADVLTYTGSSTNPMQCVASSPAQGQYSVDQITGIYTFAAADTGAAVSLRYATRVGLYEMQQYCFAQGLFISLLLDSQTSVSSILNDLCSSLNLAPVWSGGTLNFRPRGTLTVSGNGFTWTAPSAPLFDLTDDDFVIGGGSSGSQTGGNNTDPVLLSRSRPSDQINDFKLEWLDRSNQYAPAVAEAKDQANIDVFTLRPPSSVTGHYFTSVTAANVAVQLMLQGQYIRNIYSFTVDERYAILDPMDVVSLTDTNDPAIQDQWVQITEITENDDGTLSMVANEYPLGTGQAADYNYETGQGFIPNYSVIPGSVNAPVVIAAPHALTTNQGMEVWIALSGSVPATWGGAHVWISSDGSTYRNIGMQNLPTRMGLTTTTLPLGLDPDTVNQLDVNLAMSNGQIASGTQFDADQGNTLCLINSTAGTEYISYETAVLIGTYAYRLETYLRRGQYNTSILSHPIGASFVRLDQHVFRLPYQPTDIGKTFYLKFTSFNVYGNAEEVLSEVAAYPVVMPSPPTPPDVTNFSVNQFAGVVTFRWDPVQYPLIALAGYYIGYAPEGTTDWGLFKMLTFAQGGSGTEMTNADVPAGKWVFGIRAASIANASGSTLGLSPDIATANCTVESNTDNISNIEQSPDWDGQMTGFSHDGFGLLIPHGSKTVDSYPALAPPPAPTLSSVASGLSLTFTGFVKITYVTKFGETIASLESSQAITSGHAVKVTSPAAYGNATGYNVYMGTSSGANTQQNGTPINIGTDWTQSIAVFTGASLPVLNTTGFEAYGDDFVPDPVGMAYYIPDTVDAGIDLQISVAMTSTEVLGPRQTGSLGTGISFGLDSWASTGSDSDVFVPWVSGSVVGRYLRVMLLYSGITASQVQCIRQFLPAINKVTSVIASNNVVIAPGGTTVIFDRTYLSTPFVTATVVTASALFASVTAITTSQCVIHVWNTSGTDVGGTVNVQITGE